MMTKFRRLVCTCAILLLSSFGNAQEFRGTLSGAITDPASALVAGAKIVATETKTGTKVETVSDSSGQYTLPFLAPGDYDISVQSSGFKEFIRKSLHIGAGEHPVVDVALEIGNTTQTVEVVADVSLV